MLNSCAQKQTVAVTQPSQAQSSGGGCKLAGEKPGPSREPKSGQPTRKTIEEDEDGVIKSEFARKCIPAFLAHGDPWTDVGVISY